MNSVLFAITALVSFTIQSITGFGGSLLAMPIAMQVLGTASARFYVSLISFLSGFVVAVVNRKSVNAQKLVKIILLMTIGVLCGVTLEDKVEASFLERIYGVVIIAYAVFCIIKQGKVKQHSKIAEFIILLFAGIMHGLFASGGAFLMLYAVNAFGSKEEFSATSCAVWAVINPIMITIQHISGVQVLPSFTMIMICVGVAPVTALAAQRLQNKICNRLFIQIENVLLLCTGIIMLFP